MAELNASRVNHPWNLMVSCGKYGPLEPFCLHASVLLQLCGCAAHHQSYCCYEKWLRNKSSVYSHYNTANSINLGDHLWIKFWLFKTWQSSSFMQNRCHVASHLTLSFPSEWLCSLVWTVLPLRVKGWQEAHIIQLLQELCWHAKYKESVWQHSSRGILLLTFCFSLLSQEEEIPELEIDIDELLELTDEGQRTRLHVRLCKLK